TLRRNPDLRWRRTEDDIMRLATAELTMLRHAAEVVAPGGRLVYATCSSEPEENEDVVDQFLQRTPAFSLVDARIEGFVPTDVLDGAGRLRTYPHVHGLEAFFAAVLKRAAS